MLKPQHCTRECADVSVTTSARAKYTLMQQMQYDHSSYLYVNNVILCNPFLRFAYFHQLMQILWTDIQLSSWCPTYSTAPFGRTALFLIGIKMSWWCRPFNRNWKVAKSEWINMLQRDTTPLTQDATPCIINTITLINEYQWIRNLFLTTEPVIPMNPSHTNPPLSIPFIFSNRDHKSMKYWKVTTWSERSGCGKPSSQASKQNHKDSVMHLPKAIKPLQASSSSQKWFSELRLRNLKKFLLLPTRHARVPCIFQIGNIWSEQSLHKADQGVHYDWISRSIHIWQAVFKIIIRKNSI
jgi:hypothetical protein